MSSMFHIVHFIEWKAYKKSTGPAPPAPQCEVLTIRMHGCVTGVPPTRHKRVGAFTGSLVRSSRPECRVSCAIGG